MPTFSEDNLTNAIYFIAVFWLVISPFLVVFLFVKMKNYKEWFELEVMQSNMYIELFEAEHKYVKALEKLIKDNNIKKL